MVQTLERPRLQEGQLFLKACPRCRGDVLVRNDMYGWYLDCLQCSHDPSSLFLSVLSEDTGGKKREGRPRTTGADNYRGKKSL